MNSDISEKLIGKVASGIRGPIKTKIGDVYPNIDREGLAKEIITKWYVNTLVSSCNQAINKYPIKHLSIGVFYHKNALSPITIHCSGYRSSCYTSQKTFSQLIIEQKDKRPLLIKVVDNDDNIYLYQASSKLSNYNIADMFKEISDIFCDITYIPIMSDNTNTVCDSINSFAYNLSEEIKQISNDAHWVYHILYWDEGLIKILFDHALLNRESWRIEIDIKAMFEIYNLYKLIKEYTLNSNIESIIKRYMYLYVRVVEELATFANIKNYSNKFKKCSDILNYIGSATHLLNPLWESLLSALSDKYNNLKWFVNAIEMLQKDPNYSFEDLFTVIKYNVEDKELKIHYLNIYNI